MTDSVHRTFLCLYNEKRTNAMTDGNGSTNLANRITANPAICGGRPCVRGMRIRVSDVLDLLAANVLQEQILIDYPYLEKEDITACLQFASGWFDHPVLLAS